MKNRFIRLSTDTFRALIAKKCQDCPLRDVYPSELQDIRKLQKLQKLQKRRTRFEEEEEIKIYYARP
jgi:hypothetical protein